MGFGARRALAVAIVAFLLAPLALLASCGRLGTASCSQCGRDECKNLAFTISLANGDSVKTCCPRCALRYLAEKRPAVATLAVRSFADARTLDARKALYVEGSDVHPCATHEDAPAVDQRGCCLKAVYDRCEPSLVAFESVEQAESFARDHGGFVRTFGELESAQH
jgi:hypothetical protein